MTRPPGIIVNPHSGGARRDPSLPAQLEALLPPGHVQVTPGPEAVEGALSELREREIEALVIAGGDGSVRSTLTALFRVWPGGKGAPAVVLTCGGTVNTVARSLGGRRRPVAAVERLLSRLADDSAGDSATVDATDADADADEPAPDVKCSERPALQIVADGGEEQVGMIYGNGVTVRWLELYYRQTRQGVIGATAAVARAAASAAVRGPLASALFRPMEARLTVDGELAHEGDVTITGASGVADVGLGFRPFWSAAREPDAFHFLWTDASAARLSAELPALRLGLHGPLSCLRHHPAHSVLIETDRTWPWSLDADLFPPTHRLELRPTPPLRFWHP